MRAISVRQPFAWLVVNGFKTVENRSRRTPYRGAILIHAGGNLAMPPDAIDFFRRDLFKISDGKIALPQLTKLQTGGIVGIAELVDCIDEPTDSNDRDWWEPGQYAYIIRNARPLPFIAMPGKLNIYEVDNDLIQPYLDQLTLQ